MKVAVIIEESGVYDAAYSCIYGVYVDIKTFHDEARAKKFSYDDTEKCFYSVDAFGDMIYYVESVQTIRGYNFS